MRLVLVVCALVALAVAAGCGGGRRACGHGDRRLPRPTTETQPEPASPETETEARRPRPRRRREPGRDARPSRAPETETEPSGRSGRVARGPARRRRRRGARALAGAAHRPRRAITPRVVRVPAFISIRVELRSADGGPYGLRFGGRTLRAGGALASASTVLDGLRPGAAVVGQVRRAGATRCASRPPPNPALTASERSLAGQPTIR